MTDAPELKPCPFCGSDNVQAGGDDKVVGVWCHNCQASGPNGYLTINGDHDWNTRADLPPAVKPLVWVTPSPTTDGTWQDENGMYDIEEGILFIGHVETGIPHDTDEAAKATAQAHHDAYILSRLVGGE